MPRRAESAQPVDAVVIGRNEGQRLIACLASMQGQVRRVVYVDSGSTDGSPEAARAAGARVVELDMSQPFTAARARNAGLKALEADPPALVQFIDGDCTLQPGWIDQASGFLDENEGVAVVCGRRRERYPQSSVYNALCDAEWNTPVGKALSCGGDALMRYAPVAAIGGFRNDLIAGEEPELCLRLRKKGWSIWRIDAEMTLHDAAISRFGQWWRRVERGGYAFAEGATRFSSREEPFRRREYARILVWGLALPLAVAALALIVHPLALALLLAYPAQVWRLHHRMGWRAATLNTLGKFAEAQGALRFHLRRLTRRDPALIEYK